MGGDGRAVCKQAKTFRQRTQMVELCDGMVAAADNGERTAAHQETVTLRAVADAVTNQMIGVQIGRNTLLSGCQQNGTRRVAAAGGCVYDKTVGFANGYDFIADHFNAKTFDLYQTAAEQFVTADRFCQTEIIFDAMALAESTGIAPDDKRRIACASNI